MKPNALLLLPIISLFVLILPACGAGGPTSSGGSPGKGEPTIQQNGPTIQQNGPKKLTKRDDLLLAVLTKDAVKVKSICTDDPSLGAIVDSDQKRPLLVDTIGANTPEVALALIEHCDLPINYKDNDGNSLLILFIYHIWVHNKLIFEPIAVKLIHKLPKEHLKKENDRSVSALSWAIKLKNQPIADAIVSLEPELKRQPIAEALGSAQRKDPRILALRAGIKFGRSHFNNEYASKKEKNGVIEFKIKQKILEPLFIKLNGSILIGKDIDQISFEDALDTEYILLPKSHWFARNFVHNPFIGLSQKIVLTRPSLWGFELKNEKEESDSILFSKEEAFSQLMLPKIDNDFFQNTFQNLQPLGKGGIGEVFSFVYQGKEYALKRNAPEIKELEKLQFTKAVVEVYGGFEFNNEKYQIMMKGEQSLADMIIKGEKIDDKLLAQTLSRFIRLTAAEKKLDVENWDIKPANMLLTADGIKIIDISKATTHGYEGAEGRIMVRLMIEASKGSQIYRGGRARLGEYYEHAQGYREENVASSDYLTYWNRFICETYELKDDCSDFDNFDKVFELFDHKQLQAFGEQTNDYFTHASVNKTPDNGGTHDHITYGEYKTGLPFPHLRDPADIKWQDYFAEKDKIGPQFCEKIHEHSLEFYKRLRTKYKTFCTLKGEEYESNFVFNSAEEPAFKSWVFDVFSPIVKNQTFKVLARRYTFQDEKVFQTIIKGMYQDKNIQDLFIELLKAS